MFESLNINPSKRVLNALQFFFIGIVIVLFIKPSFLYDQYGNFKSFGNTDDENTTSVISFSAMVFFLAIVSYYVACYIEMNNDN